MTGELQTVSNFSVQRMLNCRTDAKAGTLQKELERQGESSPRVWWDLVKCKNTRVFQVS